MTPQLRKRILLAAAGLAVLALIVWSFLPKPVPVETATVSRGPLQVIVEEEGETQVAEQYAVTAPIAGILRRIELEEGDVVGRGQPLLRIDPPRPALLDVRSRNEAAARVRAAEATLQQAEAELARTERLAAGGSATRQALELAGTEAARARAELAAARAALQSADGTGEAQALRAPAGGRVLAVRRRSEGQVNPGDTLVVIGDTRQLEVHADVLSQDAVRIRPGSRVLIEQWGGDSALEARVTRVEPQAHTVVSSLGVEEQRVNVIAALAGDTPPPAGLGAGYRVLARFVIWEADDVLQVPSSALFRIGDGWAVFAVANGRAIRRDVQVGQQAGLQTQILDGLTAGEEVVVHPGNELVDGARVATDGGA
jgi:HlyD family secretion protein